MYRATGEFDEERGGGKVHGMWGPEGVGAALIAVVAIGPRERRRVQLAREREQELLAELVSGITEGGREMQIHHGGAAGAWTLPGTAGGGTAGREATVEATVPVRGHALVAGRRR
ncbi:hypothetical protein ABZ478_19415 [Streptomyces sp. NPDC005706]|uniref:hypothetical protein n=1 Tax=Streptomyces sp. NPDC005706 TaxID=3157169 RepID=UPI0033D83BDC